MTKHRLTNTICIAVTICMLAITTAFLFGEGLGISVASANMPYVEKLFSTDRVHTLDIVVDEGDWAGILENPMAKEYIAANLVLDGEAVKNVGIRTKGNSSLSTIAGSDSDRYSLKIEFDQYVTGRTYYGLDKLALNNIAQDNTYLKDYLSYRMMGTFDADAPLVSFIWITVNGEDWGLYLAVEGIEEAFAERNYGSDYGQIYKPDSMNMMGGNRDGGGGGFQFPSGGMPDFSQMQAGDFQLPEGFELPEGMEFPEGFAEAMQAASPGDEEAPVDGTADPGAAPAEGEAQAGGAQQAVRVRGGGGFGFGGMGGGDVALVYTDDDPESYPNIFESAKFTLTEADKAQLIASLGQLSEGENLGEVVNIDEVLRYFVVHNFVLNFDSYTGSMMHNYYLYVEDGVMSMIAWDYNLAFGAFSMGGGMGGWMGGESDATSTINYPIDTPVSGTTLEDRPLLGQLLADETTLALYHQLFDEFIASYFESGAFEAEYDAVVRLISPYVERDPSAFCTYEEYLTATEQLRAFCLLRAESVRGQLDGTIPSTSEGQAEDSASFVDGSGIDIQSMGSHAGSMNRARGRGADGEGENAFPDGGMMAPGMGGRQQEAEPAAEDQAAEGEGQAAQAVPMAMSQAAQQAEPAALAAVPAAEDATGDPMAQAMPDAQEGPPSGEAAAQQGQQSPMDWQNRQMPGGQAGAGTASDTSQVRWLYVGISALVLVLGIAVAKIFWK